MPNQVNCWSVAPAEERLVLTHACVVAGCCERHTHDTFFFAVNERGAHRSFFRGGEIVVPAGAVVAFAPGEVHSGERVGDEPWCSRGVFAPPAFVRSAASNHGRHLQFPKPVIRDDRLASALLDAHTAAENGIGDGEGRLQDVLGALVRDHARPVDPPRAAPGLDRARAHIDEHFAKRITIADLAALAELSPFHFLRRFGRRFGMPPYAYVMDRRVRHATRLIAEGEPIGHAALAAGFADQSHFTRHFKRHAGLTPGVFARAMKNGVRSLAGDRATCPSPRTLPIPRPRCATSLEVDRAVGMAVPAIEGQ